MDMGLDWVNGDKLGLPATNVEVYDSETVIVESYDPGSGLVELTAPLQGYHFGASDSTADDYSGIDMRGEVLLLSSNVNVTASTDALSMTPAYPRPYGCQILVSDFFEPSDFTYRYGSINFDNVAVYNCSQEKTEFAGIKFHYAVKGVKKVTNSAISSGLGEGIIIKNSKQVTLDNNVIHDFILYGIHAEASQNIVINSNVVNGVRIKNDNDGTYMKWNEVNGGISMMDSSDFTVTNNIVASTWHSGYMLPAHKCGESPVHYGNVAHSISGYGVIVTKKYDSKCSEFSDFKGYKTRIATVHMGGGIGSAENIVSNIVTVDSSTGLMAFGKTGGHVLVKDSTFYGD